jgi:hypothetical protein
MAEQRMQASPDATFRSHQLLINADRAFDGHPNRLSVITALD